MPMHSFKNFGNCLCRPYINTTNGGKLKNFNILFFIILKFTITMIYSVKDINDSQTVWNLK